MNIGIKDVLYQIRLYFIPYLVVLCCCLLIKVSFSKEAIFFAVNSHNYPWADTLAPLFTDLGYGWPTVALVVILVFFNYRKAFLLAVAYAVTSIVAQIIKHIFDTPRPKMYFQNQLAHIHFVKGIEILNRGSFPSGHTVTAFSTTLLVAYWCKDKKWQPPLLLLAMLIGYSRMYLSEHFFGDVIGGSVIGVFITVFLIAWLDNKKFLHSEKWGRGLLKAKKAD